MKSEKWEWCGSIHCMMGSPTSYRWSIANIEPRIYKYITNLSTCPSMLIQFRVVEELRVPGTGGQQAEITLDRLPVCCNTERQTTTCTHIHTDLDSPSNLTPLSVCVGIVWGRQSTERENSHKHMGGIEIDRWAAFHALSKAFWEMTSFLSATMWTHRHTVFNDQCSWANAVTVQ